MYSYRIFMCNFWVVQLIQLAKTPGGKDFLVRKPVFIHSIFGTYTCQPGIFTSL